MEARLVLAKKGNPDIFLASKDKKKDDYFYVVYKGTIVKDIYKYRRQWYIWDHKKKYRNTIANFTAALKVVEEELCEA